MGTLAPDDGTKAQTHAPRIRRSPGSRNLRWASYVFALAMLTTTRPPSSSSIIRAERDVLSYDNDKPHAQGGPTADEVAHSVGGLVTVPTPMSQTADPRFQEDARSEGVEALGELATTSRVPSSTTALRGRGIPTRAVNALQADL